MPTELPAAPPSAVFRHCPSCAAPRGATWDAVRFVCEACGFVYFYNVAVSASVAVVGPDGHVLFVRRAHAPGKDKLALPGGFIDRGETAEEAAAREVREESGLVLGGVEFLASFPNLYPYRGVEYPVLDLFFSARVERREAVALDEVTEVVWAAPDTLTDEDLGFPSHARALRELRRRIASRPV
jgi:ADP-ribose pyrophosphatase YjhB (NUDIX family)